MKSEEELTNISALIRAGQLEEGPIVMTIFLRKSSALLFVNAKAGSF